MKNLYHTVQEMLREGKSIGAVAKALDLPRSTVREIREDMEEWDEDFGGNAEHA
jgi:DNA-binding IclR family transcriptional regulator